MGTTSAASDNDLTSSTEHTLDVRIRFVPHLPVIGLSGALRADDLRVVRDALTAVLAPMGHARIMLLDLRRVVSCDGVAAAGLARLLAGLRQTGSEVRMQGPPDLVSEIEQRAASWIGDPEA